MSLLSDGLTIDGADTWVFATLVVWIVTMLATLFLPLLLGKRMASDRRDGNRPIVHPTGMQWSGTRCYPVGRRG